MDLLTIGAFAAFLKRRGITVTGSDQNVYPPMSDVLREAGVVLYSGYDAANLRREGPDQIDLVVIGNVVRSDNPEAREAIGFLAGLVREDTTALHFQAGIGALTRPLPDGLTLSASGLLTGTPTTATASGAPATFTVTAADGFDAPQTSTQGPPTARAP